MSSLASLQRIKQADAALAANCSDYYNHVDFRDLRRAIAEAVEAAAPKLVKAQAKPKAPCALEFWHAHGQAVDAIAAVYGANWKIKAPVGETELVTLAGGLRSCKTERGTVLKWPRDGRMPAARYWPNSVLPVGVETSSDYPRHDPNNIVMHDAAWHTARGYIWSANVDWTSELGARAAASHRDAVDEFHARKAA